MRRTKLPKSMPDPVKGARVDELLRIAGAFAASGRAVPGHVRRELVRLAAHWGKRDIPADVVEARKILGRAGK